MWYSPATRFATIAELCAATRTCCAGSTRCSANAASSKGSRNTTSHSPTRRKRSGTPERRGPRPSRRSPPTEWGLFLLCHDASAQRADRRGVHLDKVIGLQETLRRGAAVGQ